MVTAWKSIPQFHDGCKLLAVNALYVYGAAADVFIIIAPDSVHVNTGEIANLESYKTRVWCGVEQFANFSAHSREAMFIMTSDQLEPMTNSWMSEVVCIFDAQMICCRLQHTGMNKCDRRVSCCRCLVSGPS